MRATASVFVMNHVFSQLIFLESFYGESNRKTNDQSCDH